MFEISAATKKKKKEGEEEEAILGKFHLFGNLWRERERNAITTFEADLCRKKKKTAAAAKTDGSNSTSHWTRYQ